MQPATVHAAHALFAQLGHVALPLIAALTYDTPLDIRMVPGAAALICVPPTVSRQPASIWVAAADHEALLALLGQGGWPPARWYVCQPEQRALLEAYLGCTHRPERDELLFVAHGGSALPHPLVRPLALADVQQVQLDPCGLSPTALRHWIWRGWRFFGAVESGRLLCHALAAYPLAQSDEIAAVFTAPEARGRGLATAVVAAIRADIHGRGRFARYLVRRNNHASVRIANRLGMQLVATISEISPSIV